MALVWGYALAGATSGYLPRYQELATLPRQGALIYVSEGLETMIVEPAFEAGVGSQLWIVPVPSEPISVEPAMPGVIESLRFTVRPNFVVSTLDPITVALFPTFPLVGLYALVRGYLVRARSRRPKVVLEAFLVWIALVAPWVAFVPAPLTHMYRRVGPPVENPKVTDAGSYSIAVVPPSEAESFLGRESDLLTSEQVRVLRSYADDGWFLCAAKFDRKVNSGTAPRPMKVRFRTEQPVYPMRLAEAGQGKRVLDLFVVAEGTANARGLEVWRSERVARGQEEWSRDDLDPCGHPELRALDAAGYQLTRLRGEASLGHHTDDLQIGVGRPRTQQATMFSAGGAASTLFLLGCPLLGLLLVIQGHRMAHRRAARVRDPFAASGSALALTLTAIGGSYFGAETIEVGWQHRPDAVRLDRSYFEGKAVDDGFPELVHSVAREVYAWRDKLDAAHFNRDIPFGYTVEETAGGFRVTSYDRNANPRSYIMKRTKPGSRALIPSP